MKDFNEGAGSMLDMAQHRCPFPKCSFFTTKFMCPRCWARIPGPERRAIVAELKVLASRGQKKPSPRLKEAFLEGLRGFLREAKQFNVAVPTKE